MKRRRFRPRLRALEGRDVPTAVSWDGGAGTLAWTDALNWSTDSLPGATDDVTLDAAGSTTIQYSGGSTTIASLALSDSLTLNSGTIAVSGAFTATNVALTAKNASAFSAAGATTADAANLVAENSGQISLPGLTSYLGAAKSSLLQANGPGAKVSLPNLTTLTGSNHPVLYPRMRALAGGIVEAPAVASLTSGSFEFKADGTNSQIDLSAITTVAPVGGDASLYATAGGTLKAPALTQLSRANLTFDGTGSSPTSQFTQLIDGELNISGGVYSFPNLATFNCGAVVSGGATVTLSAVTAYQGSSAVGSFLDASGAGTQLNLPNLATFQGSTHPVLYPHLRALNGGTVSVPLVSQITSGNLELKADGAGSTLLLPALTKVDVGGSADASLTVTKGATLTAPLLAQFGRTNLTLDGAGAWTVGQIAQFLDGQVTITGGTYSFSNMATFNGGAAVSGGASVTLGALTAYQASTALGTYLSASGAGSQLSLPNLTSLKGSTHPVLYPHVRALAGGTVSMPLIGEITFGNIELKADGAGSLLSFPALTKVQIAASLNADVTVTLGGQLAAPLLTKLGRAHFTTDATSVSPLNQLTEVLDSQITITGGTHSLANLTTFNGGVAASGGAVVTVPTITAYEGSAAVDSLLHASGAGSQLLLPNLATIKGSTHPALYPHFKALAGGFVSVPLVSEVTSGYIEFAADGAGSEVSTPLFSKFTLPSNQDGYFKAANSGKLTSASALTIDYVWLDRDPTGVMTFTDLNALAGSLVAIEGAIAADISAAGTVEVRTGLTAGATAITGNLTLVPTSTVEIDLGGTTPGTQYNQISVTGTATLAGTLDVGYFNGFKPSLGQSFDVITGGVITGFFSDHVNLDVSAAVELTPSYPGGKVTLAAVTAAGPRVIAQSPSGTVTSPLSSIDITFNEPMNAPTFSPIDVTFTGPSGTVTINSITQLAPDTFRLHFGTLTKNGGYTLKVGPGVGDAADFNMDQNVNGTKGENPGDIYTGTLTLAVAPPRVASLTVNGGVNQRSMVTSLTVYFDTLVNLPVTPETAFTLTRQSTSETVTLAANVANGSTTTVTLTFTGGPLEGGSLADGRYTLAVDAASVTDSMSQELDGDGDGTAGDDFQHVGNPTTAPKLYRLFGDVNGDGFTDNIDLIQFRQANGSDSTAMNFNPAFDVNGDGFIDNVDLLAFRQRIGVPV